MLVTEYNELCAQLGSPLVMQPITQHNNLGPSCVAFWQSVYDRTLADCAYGNRKGCLDMCCFNRIEQNMQYLKYCIEQQGIYPLAFTQPVQYRNNYLYLSMWNRLKRAMLGCKECFENVCTFQNIELSAPCELIHYTQVNDLEYLQWQLFCYIRTLGMGQYCVNDLYSGDYMYGGDGA